MHWSWIDLAFPWIGLVAVAALLPVLFGTNLLRGTPTLSRWRDPAWLSWLGVVAYLLHNVEEYGRDLLGHPHAFPDVLCATLRLPAYPGCPVPPAFFLAVNIPLFWVVAPAAALVGRRRPLVGLAVYGVIFVNGVVHCAQFLRSGFRYNPGLFTAVVVFLPLSVWVARTCFGERRPSYRAMGVLVFWGASLHVILAGSVILFIKGLIGGTVLVGVQVVNAALLLLVPWLAEQWRGGTLLRPRDGGRSIR